MRIFSAMWGGHLDLFENGCLTSMLWPKNREAIQGATWVVATRSGEVERIAKMFDGSGIQKLEILQIPDDQEDPGLMMLPALIGEIGRCLSLNEPLLMAPADTIFGDGSIPNMIKIGRSPAACVSAAHPRVLASVLDDIACPLTNSELVSVAFANLHDSWTQSRMGLEDTASFEGGVSWDTLDDMTYYVSHRLPTPYYVKFIPSDLSFFKRAKNFGEWDHSWPAQLIKQERQRLVGSSDAAFMCEITDEKSNMPGLHPYHPMDPDCYYRQDFNHQINRGFTSIFRGA